MLSDHRAARGIDLRLHESFFKTENAVLASVRYGFIPQPEVARIAEWFVATPKAGVTDESEEISCMSRAASVWTW